MSAENGSKDASAGTPAPLPPVKSFGPMSPAHWSRARAGENAEALAYLRERSKAPGVADGGAERNFYCMKCAGVIPFDLSATACPHCGEPLDEKARRYFNWVEINEPPRSDLAALLPIAAVSVLVFLGLAFAVWCWLR